MLAASTALLGPPRGLGAVESQELHCRGGLCCAELGADKAPGGGWWTREISDDADGGRSLARPPLAPPPRPKAHDAAIPVGGTLLTESTIDES